MEENPYQSPRTRDERPPIPPKPYLKWFVMGLFAAVVAVLLTLLMISGHDRSMERKRRQMPTRERTERTGIRAQVDADSQLCGRA